MNKKISNDQSNASLEAAFSDLELLRYSRHLLLPSLGLAAQAQWKNSSVCIVGCGGLGNPLSLYLAGAGVGHITLIDDDHVDISNLARQVAFKSQNIGALKAQTLQTVMTELNSEIQVEAFNQKLTPHTVQQFKQHAFDLIFDCTDHFESRYLVNSWSRSSNIALVSAAAIEFQGLCVLLNNHQYAPCYACLFPKNSEDAPRGTCAENGIFSPVLGVVSSVQADLGLRYLATQYNQNEGGQEAAILYQWNSQTHEMRKSTLKQDPHCTECRPG